MHIVSKAWRIEYGANVAQAAAVALLSAALIGAVILFAPQLRQRVETDFGCLAGALGGAGAGCPGTAPTSLEELGEGDGGDYCDWKCQIIGVLKGFALGGWDALFGLFSLAKDLFLLITGDDETWAKYKHLVEAFMRDPVGVAQALLGEMAAPILEAWNDGQYGEASGRLLFEVISSVGGTKALNILADLGKLDEVGDVGRVVDDIPCVGAAPAGKAPGLAKPAEQGCRLPTPTELARNKSALDAALRNRAPTRFNGPDGPVAVTNERLRHILERHHPSYWNGTRATQQSFFDKNLTVRDIENIMRETVQRGRREGKYYIYEKDGVRYRATVENGQVVQFHPLED